MLLWDECDSILIDEARTPLIISGSKDDAIGKYKDINHIIPELKKNVHFFYGRKIKNSIPYRRR